MILPQIEQYKHGAEVVGMFFFDDKTFILQKVNPIGERLTKIAAEKNILLMLSDQCALERELATSEPGDANPCNTYDNVRVGYSPDLYAALSGSPPD